MRLKTSKFRAAASLALPLLALLAAACGSAQESTQTTNARNANGNAASVQTNTTPASATNTNAGQPASGASAKAKLNLNTATREEFLAAVPNLGNKMAHEFEEYRPYKSIQQFRKEMAKYVKPEQIAEYEKYVFVPVNANESDAATLQQIPGLDAAEAQALISARPFASDEAFLSKLAGSVSESELALARTYLSGR